jgi:hypothetical protein
VVIPRRGDFYELDQLKLAGDLGPIFHLFRDGYFYWKKKLEYLEKTTDQSQVTDKRVFYKEYV